MHTQDIFTQNDFTLRTIVPEQDFPRIAELLSADQEDDVLAEDLLEDEGKVLERRILRHRVAEIEQHDGNHQIIGYSFAGYYPSSPAGEFYTNLVVDPAYRGRGLGQLLADELSEYLRSQNANQVWCEVHEGDDSHKAFAERRGLAVRSHQLRATLDLATFDDAPFAHFIERAETTGVRLCAFADVERSEKNIRQLYDINGVAALDDPASDGAYIAYENWIKIVLNGSWFQPEGQMIALDGDTFVGLSAITYEQESNTGSVLISGVDKAYRGRKIMQALKLMAIRYAQQQGASRVVTEYDARNELMRAIHKKFGFVESPGRFEMSGGFV
ncbi:MAG: GNAT family N-acetyltransferase [Chloroflexota bacterium]